MLRAVSAAVPRELDVTVNQFALDGRVIHLGGVANSFNTVEDMKSRLSGTPLFSEARIVSASAAAGGKGVQFNLELVRKGGGK
jgi:Tfp pilus assembly protein PilN